MINKKLWVEDLGPLVRDSVFLQAKRRHAAQLPPLTAEAWQAQRVHLLAQVRENIGSVAAPCPLDVREYGEVQMPTHRIKKITFQSRPGFRVTANLFIPQGEGPFPGLLVVHGHWPQGRVSVQVQSRCHLFASQGYVVLCVDACGSGERGTHPGQFEYHGAQIGASLLNIGETLLGMQVNDNMRAIDLLQSLECVDGAQIGVTGASGGGNQTMWISALDPRVKAAVPVVSVGTFEAYITERNCICEVLPNGLTFLEEWAVLGLVAPNALLILNSLRDTHPFCVKEMIRSYTTAREVFALHGVSDRIAYQGIDLPHGYWPEMQRHALGWFNRWLKGEGEGRPCEIAEIAPLPYQELLCFPEADRPAEVQSIHQFVRPIAESLAAGHRESADPLCREEKARELATLLRAPAAEPVTVTPLREVREGDLTARCFQIEVEPGIPLPVEVYSKAGTTPEQALLVVHHEGQQDIPREPWLRERLDAGQALVFVDLRHTGLTRWDRKEEDSLVHYHDAFRSTLWLGRTMVGEWVRDLITVALQVKAVCAVQMLELFAYRDAGVAALCAAALSDQFARVTTCETVASYVPEQGFFAGSMAIHVPKILPWGDISLMAAIANADVRLLAPTRSDGVAYTAEEIAAYEQELAALARRLDRENRVTVQGASMSLV